MKVGKVVGTVVSTINISVLDGHRLLLCESTEASDRSADYTIALDVVDAGIGDTVLILDEGTSARQIFGYEWGAIRAVVVGIVDEVIIEGQSVLGGESQS